MITGSGGLLGPPSQNNTAGWWRPHTDSGVALEAGSPNQGVTGLVSPEVSPLNLPMTILSCVLTWPSSVYVPSAVSMFRFPLLTRTPVTLD